MEAVLDAPSAHPYLIDFSALYKKAAAISQAYRSGNLVFFLGSGASKTFAPNMANWTELLTDLLSRIETKESDERRQISALIKNQRYLLAAEAIKKYGSFGTAEKGLAVGSVVAKMLDQRMNMSEKNPILHLAILDFSVPIFTTNYDNIIEQLIAEHKVEGYRHTALTYEDQEDAARLLNPTIEHENYVFKLHGSVDKTQRLILSEKDYYDFYFDAYWPKSLQLLRHILATKMVVFVGFSLSDPDIMLILREATRYSSSYQHLALMYKSTVTSIEREVMQSSYRVDPVLYEDHAHLPLYIMEMRNFYHREDIALQLKSKRDKILVSLAALKKEKNLESGCSVILFGSFAKFGDLIRSEADADFLLLTDSAEQPAKQIVFPNEDLGRKIDVTLMMRSEFERLLRNGDPFASSILVTGSPLDDPDDRYGILCRGFRGNYKYETVLKNAKDRYRMRWLRLCIYKDAEIRDYLQACYQWAITLMQFFIIKNRYPLDSLLGISLLSNARYTIREFANRFNNVDEEYFISIMQAAKGLPSRIAVDRPSQKELPRRFLAMLQSEYPAREDLEMLLPGDFIRHGDLPEIKEVYKSLIELLEPLSLSQRTGYGATNAEQQFLDGIAMQGNTAGRLITTFDSLFFFLLHELVRKEGTLETIPDERLLLLCQSMRDQWLKEVPDEHSPA